VEETKLRRLTSDDIPWAMALKDAAGWNQTEDDWRIFLELEPDGCFALEKDGKVIATCTAATYGESPRAEMSTESPRAAGPREPFGWVGMMLVHPDERRKGHGTRMLRAAVDFLEGRGTMAALDATPLGKLLYDRRGFKDLFGIERRTGTAPVGAKPHPACSLLGERDVDGDLLRLDLESFGARRGRLLSKLLARKGAFGLAFRACGSVEGFILARPGSRYSYLGPWVARTEEAAKALWDSALARVGGSSVVVDVLVPNEPARVLAVAAGLEVSRTLVRMVRGSEEALACLPAPPGGRPDRIFGLACPAWG
jgi:GNAT superfamily N-acetyltransferase